MKTIQSHAISDALIQLHQTDDGHHVLYVQEAAGHDASAPVSAEILHSMLGAIATVSTLDVLAALARDWSPEAGALIERIRRVLHDVNEHKNAGERSALLDVVAAHLRSAPGVRRVA